MDEHRGSFVAREDELARATRAVRVGTGALVAGEAGVGKTSLAARIADRFGAGGDPVVWTVATETSRAVPFGALCPLLPDDIGSVHPTLLPHATVRALRERGGRRPVLLVVDDAQWLDEHSATAVLGVVTQRAATVLATVRTGLPAPDAVTALWKDGLLERVDVGAFDLDATRALLVERLGGEVTNLTVATLWEHTRGNPLYLSELVRFGQAGGRFASDGSVWWWQGELGVPPRLAELLDRRFHDLSAAARDVVGALALGEPLPLDALAAIAPAEAVEEVEERGLVASDARHGAVRLRFAHPLLAAVAARSLSPTRRRRLVTALAAVGGTTVDVVRRASWQLDAAEPPDVEVLLAGAAAVQLTDPELAGRFAERALPHDPSPRSALALSDSHSELGRKAPAREALRLAAGRARTDEERLAVGFTDVSVTFWSERDPDRALADLRALRHRVPASSVDIDAARALLTMFSARPAEALVLADEVLGADPPHQAAVRARIARIGALMLADRTRAACELADRVLAALPGEPVTPYTVGFVHAMSAWARLVAWGGPPDDAGVAAGSWPVRDASRGDADAPDTPVRWPLLEGMRWHVQGKLAEAESLLREALTQQRRGEGVFRTEVVTELAVVLARTGRPDDAARLLEHEPPDAVAVIPQTATWARAAIEAARGSRAEAARLVLDAAAGAAEVGAVGPALRYLADTGRHGDPAGALRVLDSLPAVFESPLTQARAAGVRARAVAAPAELLAAADQHAAIGIWGEALDLAERAVAAPGGGASAQRARAALLATELRTRLALPSPAVARPAAALTGRELEVARLAARRMTNHQIADTLVVSVRTVESHLAAAYRKLGVRSRHQLDDALGTA